jgi:hypothetical protein
MNLMCPVVRLAGRWDDDRCRGVSYVDPKPTAARRGVLEDTDPEGDSHEVGRSTMEEIADAIVAAERQRCTAMLEKDWRKLEFLLDDQLVFSHATGQVDDKAAYLAKLAAGRIDYLSVDWQGQQVIVLGPTAALLTGRMTSSVRVERTSKKLDNRVLLVWSNASDHWRVVAFQSTPLKS